MIIAKVLATIMIFLGSALLVFGLTYFIGFIFSAFNPFFLAWIIASTMLALIIFRLICDNAF